MENKTKITIAAFPIVDATPVGSTSVLEFAKMETRSKIKLTHEHNIANNVVTKRNVSSNSNYKVNAGSRANTRNYNADHAGWRVVFDFINNRKHLDKELVIVKVRRFQKLTNILMASVSKDNNWQGAESFHSTSPFDDPNVAWFSVGINRKVINNQDNQISDRNQGNKTSVLE